MNIEKSDQWKRVGGLSAPNKMPEYSYSLPADKCIMGSKLRKIKGTACSKCYSKKGNYCRGNVQRAMTRRWFAISLPTWKDDMIWLIKNGGVKHFRWHDSGDIQSVEHFEKIVEIAKGCPDTQFWIPTNEFGIVHKFEKGYGQLPSNLIVRISTPFIDGRIRQTNHVSSMVVSDQTKMPAGAHLCTAFMQGGKCLKCRSCWNKDVKLVAYKKH